MSISSLFLVGLDHTRPAVRQAAFIYAVITHGATALLTIAFLILANIAGPDFANWQALQPAGALYHLVMTLFLIGFGSKAGLAPIHVWLPRAHPAAPSHVSALMSGVMVKVAIYGLLRVVFTWLAMPSPVWGAILLGLGLISALVGALYALVDQDCKGVLAYSTIENVGLLTAGIGAATLLGPTAAGVLALGFVLLHVVSHATFKTLLFLGAGVVQGSTHTRQLDQLGGLIHRMPKAAGLILVGVLTIASAPPLAGFASEWTLCRRSLPWRNKALMLHGLAAWLEWLRLR
jgi:hydrogenase-4 component B